MKCFEYSPQEAEMEFELMWQEFKKITELKLKEIEQIVV